KISKIIETSKKRIVAYEDKSLMLQVSGGKIKVDCKPIKAKDGETASPVQESYFFVDYFVYSIGQTPSNTLTAPKEDAAQKARSFLDQSLRQDLEPIYDINQ